MINEDVDKESELITITQSKGRPLKDIVMLTKLHLIQRLFNLTNRQMESFTDILIFAKHKKLYNRQNKQFKNRGRNQQKKKLFIHCCFEWKKILKKK
jgi:hypothetical protein